MKTSLLIFSALALLAGRALAQPTTASLAGEWRFALDRADAGVKEEWFARELAGKDKIKLPGILQAQGYGDDIATDTPWVAALGDAWWKLQPESLRAPFSQPGKVEVPFLAQPPKHYLGAAWYQREIEVPANAATRRFALFLERAHWESTVWVDDRRIGSDRSLVAPHEFELGRLMPGKHRLTIRVDNRQVVRDPQNDGHGVDAHAVSDALGAAWNGIVGRIELQGTTPVWIDDAQVFPNLAQNSALIKVKIGNSSGVAGHGTLAAGSATLPVTWGVDGGAAEIEVPLAARTERWDEYHPALHRLTVLLKGDGANDERRVDFGLREIVAHEHDFVLNGRVVNLRTTHFGGDFPLTGHPAMDVDTWKKIIRRCQEFGLNGMRFHSWCPPEAAFIAADELGFYLHPELGLWAPFNPGSVYTKFMEEETPKLLKAYGNHPSFLLFAPSNEPGGRYTEITPQWAKDWYARDNRRLYSAGTGWNRPQQVTGGAQFATLVRYGRGELRNVTGWFGRDFRTALDDVHIPVLAHEIGQWCAYPDFDAAKKFTGYLRPGNYHIFRYIADQTGVADMNHDFAWASGRFQLACYKEELEADLRTPGLAGYQMLDLHDYLGQGTALIGVCDAFWDPKSYVTAEEFRHFNSEIVPLARLAQRTFTSADTLTAEAELYQFAENPIKLATPMWRIVNAAGKTVLQGEWEARELPRGKNIPLGTVTAKLAQLPAPAAYQLVVGLKNSAIENRWNFWVYPNEIDATPPADVVLTTDWAEAQAKLAAGGRVVFVASPKVLDPAKSPPMKRVPVFWNIQMTVRPPQNPRPRFDAMLGLLVDEKHPALAAFPTARACDWQWTPLIDNVPSVNLTAAPRDLKPIVAAIDDWNRNWRLGVIFEAQVGAGRLLVSTIDLQNPRALPGAAQLRRSLLDYAASDRFRPAARLTPEQAAALWLAAPATKKGSDARAFDPDLDDGSRKAPKSSTP